MRSLIDDIFELLARLLRHESRKEHLKKLIKLRSSDEGWLKSEILNILSVLRKHGSVIAFRDEVPYSGGVCDVFFKNKVNEFWMEIKTIPTNYCGGGGKPITQYIDPKYPNSAGRDVVKLGTIKDDHRRTLLLMLAYPFCGEKQEVERWDEHLDKLYTTCEECLGEVNWKEESIPLESGVEAKVYLIGCW